MYTCTSYVKRSPGLRGQPRRRGTCRARSTWGFARAVACAYLTIRSLEAHYALISQLLWAGYLPDQENR